LSSFWFPNTKQSTTREIDVRNEQHVQPPLPLLLATTPNLTNTTTHTHALTMPSDAPKYAEPMVVKNHDTSDTHNMIVGVAAGIARAPTPLPAKQLLLLCLTVFCEPLNILTPFPFVVFMVRDASDQ